MTDGTISAGDFRFRWDDSAKTRGSVIMFGGADAPDEVVATVAHSEPHHAVVAFIPASSAPMPAPGEDGTYGVFAEGAREQVKFWRCIDDAVKAVEKSLGKLPPLNVRAGARLDLEAKPAETGPSDAHIVEVVMRSIEGGPLAEAIAKRFNIERPEELGPDRTRPLFGTNTDVGATANARAEV